MVIRLRTQRLFITSIACFIEISQFVLDAQLISIELDWLDELIEFLT